jgi:hypothetical protein
MRWLQKYPITAEEVMRELNEIQLPVGPNSPIGSISPLIRHQLREYFKNPENMEHLLELLK